MHTIETLIKDVFPLGTPQNLELPAPKDGANWFRCPLEEGVQAIRRDEDAGAHATLPPEAYEYERICDGYRTRWTDAELFDGFVGLYEALARPGIGAWLAPPHDPIDLFAVCGRLLERSGAYHHIEPFTLDRDGTMPRSAKRILNITKAMRESWVGYGKGWRTSVDISRNTAPPFPPEHVEYHWVTLIGAWDESVFKQASAHSDPPAWWWSALELFVIADEAAKGAGQRSISHIDSEDSWVARAVDARITTSMRAASNGSGGSDESEEATRLYTLSLANPDSVCVLPKSRSAPVGCTIRNLSHNLALLPPQGIARAAWCYGQQDSALQDGKPLNVVLIPYPYEIDAQCFKQVADSREECQNRFGWFSVSPTPIAVPPGQDVETAREEATESFLCFVDVLIAVEN